MGTRERGVNLTPAGEERRLRGPLDRSSVQFSGSVSYTNNHHVYRT